MEETLGKRIATHRKCLSLTQDQLAEKLGVTAQAVSKWENDQSCPDISTLPRLAEIFDITTDALLGVESRKPIPAIPETADDNDHTFEISFDDEKKGKNFEFHYDAGRKSGIGIALWMLLTAALMLVAEYTVSGNPYTLWDFLWPSGLVVFGLFGLYPKFSVFRLGCALLGGYYISHLMHILPVVLNKGLWLPLFLILFGLSLLFDAFRKPGNGHIHIQKPNMSNSLNIDGETFRCTTSFGDDTQVIQMERLSGGTAELSFGELTLDLRSCRSFAPICPILLKCAFGELTLLVPSGCRAEWVSKKAFGDVSVHGTPSPDAQAVLKLNCDVSFGAITIQYL